MQHQIPPRVAALHDLSCFGRCALTVIIPTLSVMGYQTVPVPTALLSTHTGGFDDLYFRDLTRDMEEIEAHFDRLGISFRALYTGFLGSAEQIETVSRFLDRFGGYADESGEKPLIMVDPVMGDDGELYSTYTRELMLGMRRLSGKAHLLTPNLTEACFLTDTPYRDTSHMAREEGLDFANRLLRALEGITGGRIVITGIHLCDGTIACVGRDFEGTVFQVVRPHVGRSYPGTGDLFASVLLGSLLRGDAFPAACLRAAEFTAEAIAYTSALPTPVRNGVALEALLGRLLPSLEH